MAGNTMYWEDYDGQDIADFTMMGVAGGDPQPIVNFDLQLKELLRWKGDVLIRVYKPNVLREVANA